MTEHQMLGETSDEARRYLLRRLISYRLKQGQSKITIREYIKLILKSNNVSVEQLTRIYLKRKLKELGRK